MFFSRQCVLSNVDCSQRYLRGMFFILVILIALHTSLVVITIVILITKVALIIMLIILIVVLPMFLTGMPAGSPRKIGWIRGERSILELSRRPRNWIHHWWMIVLDSRLCPHMKTR